jgi:hypothetical protein
VAVCDEGGQRNDKATAGSSVPGFGESGDPLEMELRIFGLSISCTLRQAARALHLIWWRTPALDHVSDGALEAPTDSRRRHPLSQSSPADCVTLWLHHSGAG